MGNPSTQLACCAHRFLFRLIAVVAVQGILLGCGTTRWTDTSRTATEQLLIADAIERTVQTIDFSGFAGQTVFLDTEPLQGTTDRSYLVSTLRQHLLASGCLLQASREDADYVLEARAGAVGTDRHDVLLGVPEMNLPMALPGVPSQVPEIPIAKRTNQYAVARLAVFAYHRETGQAVWQSGVRQEDGFARNFWVVGAGPIQSGSIWDGTHIAGDRLRLPFAAPDSDGPSARVSVTDEAEFLRR